MKMRLIHWILLTIGITLIVLDMIGVHLFVNEEDVDRRVNRKIDTIVASDVIVHYPKKYVFIKDSSCWLASTIKINCPE